MAEKKKQKRRRKPRARPSPRAAESGALYFWSISFSCMGGVWALCMATGICTERIRVRISTRVQAATNKYRQKSNMQDIFDSFRE
jgi:hypothetical protein